MICYKTVKRYCKNFDKIENYDKAIADKTQTWCCHHRLEIAPFSGKSISVQRLIKLGLYYNVSPNALIFMPRSVHSTLHGIGNKSRTGKPHNEESKRKMSESQKGKHCWTEEMRKKQSEANRGEKNPRFGIHLSEETKKKISEANKGRQHNYYNRGSKGMHWYNNGKESKLAFECPAGFIPGRL